MARPHLHQRSGRNRHPEGSEPHQSGLAQATPSMVCAQDSLSIVPGKVVGDEPPASISLYLRHFPSAANILRAVQRIGKGACFPTLRRTFLVGLAPEDE